MAVRALLWDFGDTLVDQHFCWTEPDGIDGWTEAWRAVTASPLGERWDVGDATVDDIAAALSRQLAMPPGAVLSHLESCCTDITFFERSWAAARRSTLPQALVTVNPDVFTRWIVPAYGLDDVYPVIVTSWQARAADKATLCDHAMAALGCSDRAHTLLIDNLAENVESWRAAGGGAYLYVDDDRFTADLGADDWDGLAARSPA